MKIEHGDWVRHRERTGLAKVVVGTRVVNGSEYAVFADGTDWAVSLCIPVHPPRDKEPPKKVTWKECEEWLAEYGHWLRFDGSAEEGWWLGIGPLSWRARTRIGVVIKARAAMRRKERGK